MDIIESDNKLGKYEKYETGIYINIFLNLYII